jgi:6-phosphofructokinase
MRSGKLVIAQGGGPTAVINQSLVGAVLEARLFPQIERIYGARYGVRGIANEDFVDLSAETRANLEAIDNPELKRAAEQVRAKLEKVIAQL